MVAPRKDVAALLKQNPTAAADRGEGEEVGPDGPSSTRTPIARAAAMCVGPLAVRCAHQRRCIPWRVLRVRCVHVGELPRVCPSRCQEVRSGGSGCLLEGVGRTVTATATLVSHRGMCLKPRRTAHWAFPALQGADFTATTAGARRGRDDSWRLGVGCSSAQSQDSSTTSGETRRLPIGSQPHSRRVQADAVAARV